MDRPKDDLDPTPLDDPQLEDEGIPDHVGPLPAKVATGDAQEGLIPPTDEPQAVDSFGTTAEEQRRGRPLDDRLEAEVPDRPQGDDHARPVGQLSQEDDQEPDREPRLIAEESDELMAGIPAEEAAMHAVDEDEIGG